MADGVSLTFGFVALLVLLAGFVSEVPLAKGVGVGMAEGVVGGTVTLGVVSSSGCGSIGMLSLACTHEAER